MPRLGIQRRESDTCFFTRISQPSRVHDRVSRPPAAAHDIRRDGRAADAAIPQRQSKRDT
ncbi:hypothetical protein RRF57_001387 [Xylaria bambusicola]|uniref:Uncharacterized protein n=1 Tax=Xylaria bambusicola TaxID=326684 RepID=A0AAN7Z636_9PEZI